MTELEHLKHRLDEAMAEVEWYRLLPDRNLREIRWLRTEYAQECREEEREACAKVAERLPAQVGFDGGVQRILADEIARAIRSRSE